ncbi:MAG: antitoxin VapB family protein [Candidatus Thermoplasmatota archaeon]
MDERMVEETEKSAEEESTTIEIRKSTWTRLKQLKKVDESFDDLVNKLLDKYDEETEEEVNRDWMR